MWIIIFFKKKKKKYFSLFRSFFFFHNVEALCCWGNHKFDPLFAWPIARSGFGECDVDYSERGNDWLQVAQLFMWADGTVWGELSLEELLA